MSTSESIYSALVTHDQQSCVKFGWIGKKASKYYFETCDEYSYCYTYVHGFSFSCFLEFLWVRIQWHK